MSHGQSPEGAVFLGRWSGEQEEEEGAVLGGAFWNGEAEQVLGLVISKPEEERGWLSANAVLANVDGKELLQNIQQTQVEIICMMSFHDHFSFCWVLVEWRQ